MNPLLGRWRITSSEVGTPPDDRALDGFVIEFAAASNGSFVLGPLRGSVDYRVREGRGGWQARFSWRGTNGGEPACGRGWVRLVDDRRLKGKIFVHEGSDPRFRAVRA